jgi:2-octaprenyl-6-methoxyphenol hydroxylase
VTTLHDDAMTDQAMKNDAISNNDAWPDNAVRNDAMNHAATSNGVLSNDYQIAICGAGPVGMVLAALLAQRGIAPGQIALLDAKTLAQASLDPRSIALSYGSRQILEEVGAWPIEATPIHQIHVSRRGHFGRSLIDRAEHGLEALGYVARYGALVTRLGTVLQRLGVEALRPTRVRSCSAEPDRMVLKLDTGADQQRTLEAALVVQAEGGLFNDTSGMRSDNEKKAQKSRLKDYQQSALIAEVRTSAPVAQRAFERFTDEGPLALLPQDGGYALVWCVRPDTASALLALGDTAFLAELGRAFGNRLGRFTHASARLAYPLGLRVDANDSARMVAIGNGAQTLHPVAGQGLNLGLRDATVLARVLSQGVNPAQLTRYRALRQQDRALTVRMTDTLARLFADTAPTQALLGAALGIVDIVPPARHLLAELMMFGRR